MSKIKIIAEAGVNHNGDLKLAKKLVEVAKECGADIVKFQTFDAKKVASRHAVMAEYQKENLGAEESQEKMLQKLMLKKEEFTELASYCKKLGIRFLSTPFDTDSVHFLNRMQEIWKIPSGEITNFPYLAEIAKTGKEVILSTGMCTMEEVDAAVDVLKEYGAGKITLLHCTTNYPAPMQEVNLRAMVTMKGRYGFDVGYSDHTPGIEAPVAAAALGASVIEKHFTLDKAMEGPDHKASLEPVELAAMVKAVRNIELALGDGVKEPAESEKANIPVVRKSIIAAEKIRAGEVFTEKNLTTKRPGTGISPMKWNEIIGKKAKRDFAEDELIEV